MRDLPQSLFDVFALSLPRGHGFGAWPPLAMWQSEDGRSYAVVTKNDQKNSFGVLAVRRRIDQVWTVLERSTDYSTFDAARRRAESFLQDFTPLPVPPNTAPRPALHDLQGRTPSSLFKLLSRPSHHVAAWLLNQTYLADRTNNRSKPDGCEVRLIDGALGGSLQRRPLSPLRMWRWALETERPRETAVTCVAVAA